MTDLTTVHHVKTFAGASVLLEFATDGDINGWAKLFGPIAVERVVDGDENGEWPIYRFTGREDHIRCMIADYDGEAE